MKIFTQSARSSAQPEMQDKFRKVVLLILFISLAITALADSVQLFSDLSSSGRPYFYECKSTGILSSTSAELY